MKEDDLVKHQTQCGAQLLALASLTMITIAACQLGSGESASVADDEVGASMAAASDSPAATKDGTAPLGVARQAITGTHKTCSVFSPGDWSDTILVPQTWTQNTCIQSWRAAISGPQARVGCMVDNHVSVASCQLCLPNENSCGW
jgi:hypothetical protein